MEITDPYKILEVQRGASLEEVKKGYRKMAKRFHPDKYYGSSLESVAEERFKEIQAAYDAILEELENPAAFRGYTSPSSTKSESSASASSSSRSASAAGSASSAHSAAGSASQASGNAPPHAASGQNAQAKPSGNYYHSASEASVFNEVRLMINQCNYQRAWELLDRTSLKTPEWYFLSGLVAIRLGNYIRGYALLQNALVMDPTNEEYRFATEHYRNHSSAFTEDYYRYNASSDIVGECRFLPDKLPLCCVCLAEGPFEFCWQLCCAEECIP